MTLQNRFVPTKEEEEEEAQTTLLFSTVLVNYYKFPSFCNTYDTKFSKYNRTIFFFFFFFYRHEIIGENHNE